MGGWGGGIEWGRGRDWETDKERQTDIDFLTKLEKQSFVIMRNVPCFHVWQRPLSVDYRPWIPNTPHPQYTQTHIGWKNNYYYTQAATLGSRNDDADVRTAATFLNTQAHLKKNAQYLSNKRSFWAESCFLNPTAVWKRNNLWLSPQNNFPCSPNWTQCIESLGLLSKSVALSIKASITERVVNSGSLKHKHDAWLNRGRLS